MKPEKFLSFLKCYTLTKTKTKNNKKENIIKQTQSKNPNISKPQQGCVPSGNHKVISFLSLFPLSGSILCLVVPLSTSKA